MEQSTLVGQSVGILEDEVPATLGATHQLPPPGTTPGTQLDEGGEWVVFSQEADLWNQSFDWVPRGYLTLAEAARAFTNLRKHGSCYLCQVLDKDL